MKRPAPQKIAQLSADRSLGFAPTRTAIFRTRTLVVAIAPAVEDRAG
jgi:hypothetical protein